MAKVIYMGSGRKWAEENIGRGGAIPLGKKSAQEQPSLSTQKQANVPEKK